jgi:hypothetical protein
VLLLEQHTRLLWGVEVLLLLPHPLAQTPDFKVVALFLAPLLPQVAVAVAGLLIPVVMVVLGVVWDLMHQQV